MLLDIYKELITIMTAITIREWILMILTMCSIASAVGTYIYFFRKLKDTLISLNQAINAIKGLGQRVDVLEKNEIKHEGVREHLTKQSNETCDSIKHIEESIVKISMNITALLNKTGNQINIMH